MATNRRKVMVPNTMGQEGIALLRARDDIETVVYPPTIAQADLLPMLEDCAGIALSLTPYRQAEMDASPAMQVVARIGVGYDAVDVPALTARRVPLMVAGTANSVSVAEQAFHLMMALAKRNVALDRMVREGRWRDRHGGLPMELNGKTVLIVGFGRIGTRLAKRCLGFDMVVLVRDPYVMRRRSARRVASRWMIWMRRCRASISCRSIARRTRRRWACSAPPSSRG